MKKLVEFRDKVAGMSHYRGKDLQGTGDLTAYHLQQS